MNISGNRSPHVGVKVVSSSPPTDRETPKQTVDRYKYAPQAFPELSTKKSTNTITYNDTWNPQATAKHITEKHSGRISPVASDGGDSYRAVDEVEEVKSLSSSDDIFSRHSTPASGTDAQDKDDWVQVLPASEIQQDKA